MANLLRSISDHFTMTNSKNIDSRLGQLIEQFDADHGRLSKFQREFQRYMKEFIRFDNASQQFSDSIINFINTKWNENRTLVTFTMDLARIRSEFSQILNRQFNENLSKISEKFVQYRKRIENHRRLQNDHEKTRRLHQTSSRNQEANRTDQLRNEFQQIESVLNSNIAQLTNDLIEFQRTLRSDQMDNVVDVFKLHRKYHRDYAKCCSKFVKQNRGKTSTSNDELNRTKESLQTSPEQEHRQTEVTTDNSTNRIPKYNVLYQTEVLQDYKPENDDELELIKGELISIIEFENKEFNECDSGWSFGMKSNGNFGLIPTNFVAPIYENHRNCDDD